jgi:hypothetical protein
MLAEALGWDLKAFREAFAEASRQGLVKADFEARLIWLPNAIRYNEPENPNVVKSWRAAWDELPECKLKRVAWEALRVALAAKDEVAEKNESAWVTAFSQSCPEPSVEGSAKGMPKSCGKPSDKTCGKAPPNQEQEQDQEQEEGLSAEPIDSAPSPAVISLPLNDGSQVPISQDQVNEWSALFPAVDVLQELRNMRAWADANPTRRKTRRGAQRFIVSWLSREQNNPKFSIRKDVQYGTGANAESARTQRNRAALAEVQRRILERDRRAQAGD